MTTKNPTLVVFYAELPEQVTIHYLHNAPEDLVRKVKDIQDVYVNSDKMTEEQRDTHNYLNGFDDEGEPTTFRNDDGWKRASEKEPLTLEGPVVIVTSGWVL